MRGDDAVAVAANGGGTEPRDAVQRLTDVLELPAGVEVKTVAREGKPAERVLDYAKAHHADLLAAGRPRAEHPPAADGR